MSLSARIRGTVTKPSTTAGGRTSIWITEVEGSDPARTPLAVKDLFDSAGIRTTYGSILFDDHVPTRSAEAVLRLEAAGYATVGKANLHEFAYGTTSENAHYGVVPNPSRPAGSRAGRAAARRRRSLPGLPRRRSAPTRAARSGSRRPVAAWSG